MIIAAISFLVGFLTSIRLAKTPARNDRGHPIVGFLAKALGISLLLSFGLVALLVQLEHYKLSTCYDETHVPFYFQDRLLALAAWPLSSIYGVLFGLTLYLTQRPWKALITVPGTIVLIACSSALAFYAWDTFTTIKIGSRPPLVFRGSAEQVKLGCPNGFKGDENLTLASSYYDVMGSDLSLRIFAESTSVYCSKDIRVVQVNTARATSLLLALGRTKCDTVSLSPGQRGPPQLRQYLKLDEGSAKGITLNIGEGPAASRMRRTISYGTHLVVLPSDAAVARFEPHAVGSNGLRGRRVTGLDASTVSIEALSLRSAAWPFEDQGSRIDSVCGGDLAGLWPDIRDAFLVSESKIFSCDEIEPGGLRFDFREPKDIVLCAPECEGLCPHSVVLEGTLVISAHGASSIHVSPLIREPQQHQATAMAPGWAVLTNSLSAWIWVSRIDCELFRGSLVVGGVERILMESVAGFTVVTNGDDCGVSVTADNWLIRGFSPQDGWSHAFVSGEEIWPSWWTAVSPDAKAMALAGFVILCLGVATMRFGYVVRFFRYMILGPPLRPR